MDREGEQRHGRGVPEDEGGVLKPPDHEVTQDQQIEAILDEVRGSRRMAAIACVERGVFDADDEHEALVRYAVSRVGRVCRKRDAENVPIYATTQHKAEDGNPVVKRVSLMEQEEFSFVLDQRWDQIDADVKTTRRMEARYEAMFGAAFMRGAA